MQRRRCPFPAGARPAALEPGGGPRTDGRARGGTVHRGGAAGPGRRTCRVGVREMAVPAGAFAVVGLRTPRCGTGLEAVAVTVIAAALVGMDLCVLVRVGLGMGGVRRHPVLLSLGRRGHSEPVHRQQPAQHRHDQQRQRPGPPLEGPGRRRGRAAADHADMVRRPALPQAELCAKAEVPERSRSASPRIPPRRAPSACASLRWAYGGTHTVRTAAGNPEWPAGLALLTLPAVLDRPLPADGRAAGGPARRASRTSARPSGPGTVVWKTPRSGTRTEPRRNQNPLFFVLGTGVACWFC